MVERDKSGRFVAGQSGNPNGRLPKKREERFLEITLATVTFKDWAEIVEKAVEKAKRGDPIARKWLSDYIIGPPTQKAEITSTMEITQVELTDDERATRIEALLDKARDRRDRQAGDVERPADTTNLSEAA